jgi:hypothetical protein
MKYFMLSPAEFERSDNWFYFNASADTRLARGKYVQYVCPGCNRVDEVSAISSGVASSFKITSRYDFIETLDWVYCVSSKLRSALECNEIKGFEFLAIPKSPNYWVAVPNAPAQVDLNAAGIKYDGPICETCNRHNWSGEGPFFQSFEVSEDADTIFHPAVWNEHAYGRRCFLYCSEVVKKILSKSKLKGVYFDCVGER